MLWKLIGNMVLLELGPKRPQDALWICTNFGTIWQNNEMGGNVRILHNTRSVIVKWIHCSLWELTDAIYNSHRWKPQGVVFSLHFFDTAGMGHYHCMCIRFNWQNCNTSVKPQISRSSVKSKERFKLVLTSTTMSVRSVDVRSIFGSFCSFVYHEFGCHFSFCLSS